MRELPGLIACGDHGARSRATRTSTDSISTRTLTRSAERPHPEPRHGRGGPDLRARSSRSRTACSRGNQPRRDVRGSIDYDEYHGLGDPLERRYRRRGAQSCRSRAFSRAPIHAKPVVDRDDSDLARPASARFMHPLAASRVATVHFSATSISMISRSYAPGHGLRDERLRMLVLGSTCALAGGTATQYLGSLELYKVSAAWRRPDALDLGADPRRADFTLIARASRGSRGSARLWSVRVDAFAQQTANVLPYGQRFKIGGDRLGRGFEVAEIAGDQGLGAKLEGRRRLQNAPRRSVRPRCTASTTSAPLGSRTFPAASPPRPRASASAHAAAGCPARWKLRSRSRTPTSKAASASRCSRRSRVSL